jgi:beta-galactosidase
MKHAHRILAALAVFVFAHCPPAFAAANGPSRDTIPFNQDWLFGGKYTAAAIAPGHDDSSFERITLPHSVAKLSWQNWDITAWQHQWIYRKHFTLPDGFKGKDRRVFIYFEGVQVGVTPTINGHRLLKHFGAYLPVRYELTEFLADGENVLAVEVDSRWSNVPPQGDPVKKATSIDYLEPGGIHRQVWLESVPVNYVSDVFAKPMRVLDAADRRVEVSCTIDAGLGNKRGTLITELRDGARVIARAEQKLNLPERNKTYIYDLTLANLGEIKLWSPGSPKLYEVVTTLKMNNLPSHEYKTRIGFRDARFEPDGFYLNGKRYPIFGLNRHELFPYTGGAMPPRVMHRDAEIIKNELNCNFVRLSHYPQTGAFLDACDELGLLVWEEIPGWQYIGDGAWQELFMRDIRDMIVRDRNRPSVVIWGTRVNESRNEVSLYKRSRNLAKALDDSRPTSGSMTPESTESWEQTWNEDVFAFDDYHAAKPGEVGIREPIPGYPYFLAETVGQLNYDKGKYFTNRYRRAGDVAMQQKQAIFHAQAHDRAGGKPRMAGVVAWCAFDWGSLINHYKTLKCPGVIDTFRIPKLGAAFYQSQCDVETRPVIIPGFYWDFGPATPRGPGRQAAIFSNCDRLEVYINNKRHATLEPDIKNYPNLKHAPFFVDLDVDGSAKPELKIEGYAGGKRVLARQFSSDAAQDQFVMSADDSEIIGDGSDATRVMFKVADKYGAERAFAKGVVSFTITGPGVIIGDNPFDLEPAGGVGAVWVRSSQGGAGKITVTARHPQLGQRQVTVTVAAEH